LILRNMRIVRIRGSLGPKLLILVRITYIVIIAQKGIIIVN